MAGGRPSKYKPEYCELLIKEMSRGFSFEAVAGLLEVNVDTLYEWVKKHKEFSDAKKIAFGRNRYFWEKIGIDNIKNIYQGDNLNTTLWIFNMKNRFGWRDTKEESVDDNKQPSASVYKLHDTNKPNTKAG